MEPVTHRRFPATFEALGPIRDLAKAWSEAWGVPPKAAYGLALALDEVATNIISHGYEEAGLSGDLDMHCEVVDGRLRIILEDDAAPFDPREQPLPTDDELAQPIETRKIGGLGVFLTKRHVDRFDYERRGGRNVNIFEIALPPNT